MVKMNGWAPMTETTARAHADALRGTPAAPQPREPVVSDAEARALERARELLRELEARLANLPKESGGRGAAVTPSSS